MLAPAWSLLSRIFPLPRSPSASSTLGSTEEKRSQPSWPRPLGSAYMSSFAADGLSRAGKCAEQLKRSYFQEIAGAEPPQRGGVQLGESFLAPSPCVHTSCLLEPRAACVRLRSTLSPQQQTAAPCTGTYSVFCRRRECDPVPATSTLRCGLGLTDWDT